MQQDDQSISNYIKLKNDFIHRNWFAYIDSLDDDVKPIFRRNDLNIKEKQRWGKDGEGYIIILCKIRKKDTDKFYKCMEELKEQMKIRQITDYERFCGDLYKIIESGREHEVC